MPSVKLTSRKFRFHQLAFVHIVLLVVVTVFNRSRLNISAKQLLRQSGYGRQRIAVCIAGNTRTFHYDFVHQYLLRYAINPMRVNYSVDVFFVVRLDDANVAHRSAFTNTSIRERSRAAMDLFHAVNTTIIRDKDELSRVRGWKSTKHFDMYVPPIRCPRRRYARFPHTLMRSRQCMEAIEMREGRLGVTYDWVYRLRPDTVFLTEAPLPHELSKDVAYSNQAKPGASKAIAWWWSVRFKGKPEREDSHGPIHDQIAFSSRSVASVYMGAMDALDDCDLYETPSDSTPESVLRYWLMKNKVKYKAMAFPWVTVREYDGPECDKLMYQVGEGVEWRKSVEICYRYAMAKESVEAFPEMPNMTDALLTLPSLNRSSRVIKWHDF